jgi:hypothetical protein
MSTALFIIFLVVGAAVLYFVLFGKTDTKEMENDAKRFARLLVTEIRLYEGSKIEQGLKNDNLYEVLFDRIEEARKTYNKRIMNSEFEVFFDEALVEVLANGDRTKLGQIRSSLN